MGLNHFRRSVRQMLGKTGKIASAVLVVGAVIAVMTAGGIAVANSYPSASLAMTPFDAEAPGRGLDLYAKR